MAETAPHDQDPSQLTVEAQEKEAYAKSLHAKAEQTADGSVERAAAEDADSAANEEWEAASAVTSQIEGFTGGEPA